MLKETPKPTTNTKKTQPKIKNNNLETKVVIQLTKLTVVVEGDILRCAEVLSQKIMRFYTVMNSGPQVFSGNCKLQ